MAKCSVTAEVQYNLPPFVRECVREWVNDYSMSIYHFPLEVVVSK